MSMDINNWKTQIRKGYLELCILALINTHKSMYGSQILSELKKLNIEVKEGTLYPLLKRMSDDKSLCAKWDTHNNSGHPRKYYSLTTYGSNMLLSMEGEFKRMIEMFTILREK